MTSEAVERQLIGPDLTQHGAKDNPDLRTTARSLLVMFSSVPVNSPVLISFQTRGCMASRHSASR